VGLQKKLARGEVVVLTTKETCGNRSGTTKNLWGTSVDYEKARSTKNVLQGRYESDLV